MGFQRLCYLQIRELLANRDFISYGINYFTLVYIFSSKYNLFLRLIPLDYQEYFDFLAHTSFYDEADKIYFWAFWINSACFLFKWQKLLKVHNAFCTFGLSLSLEFLFSYVPILKNKISAWIKRKKFDRQLKKIGAEVRAFNWETRIKDSVENGFKSAEGKVLENYFNFKNQIYASLSNHISALNQSAKPAKNEEVNNLDFLFAGDTAKVFQEIDANEQQEILRAKREQEKRLLKETEKKEREEKKQGEAEFKRLERQRRNEQREQIRLENAKIREEKEKDRKREQFLRKRKRNKIY